jgi:hypothetical protein
MPNLFEKAILLKTMLQEYNQRQKDFKILLEEGWYEDKEWERQTIFHNVSELGKHTVDGVTYNHRVEYIMKDAWLFTINILYDYKKNFLRIKNGSYVTNTIKYELINLDGIDTGNFMISVYIFCRWAEHHYQNQPEFIEILDKRLVPPLVKELLEAKEVKVTADWSDGNYIELLK